MLFDRTGPWGLARRFKDAWLVTSQAAKLFFLSTILVLAATPLLLGWDVTKTSPWTRLPWGILGMFAPIALLFLWLGMWRYWVRLDDSGVWAKRGWFLVLLIGFWWGACIYYFCVYLPQVIHRRRVET